MKDVRADIVIGRPHTDRSITYEDHERSLQGMIGELRGKGLTVAISDHYSANIGGNRNKCVETARSVDAPWLLFVDDDMLISRGAVGTLMDHDLDIVSGLCVLRKPPFNPAMSTFDEETGLHAPITEFILGEMQDVDAVGGAFLLIKTKVFDKLEKPYFSFAPHHDVIIGEDFYFSRQAKAAGFNIKVDTSVVIGHIGNYPYTIEDHWAYMRGQKEKKDDS